MKGFIPPRPTGSTRKMRFDQAVWDALFGPGGKFNSTSTVKVRRSTKGVSFHAKRPKGGPPVATTLTYRRAYDHTVTYNFGDIVRVQTGLSQGVWICVSHTPITGNDPVFPEPETTGGTNKWDMWVFGVQTGADCQSGNRIVYVNASATIP